MFSPLVNTLLVIFAGLVTGAVAVAAAVVVPMVPVRWGSIAIWLGSGVVSYMSFFAYLLLATDWSK